MFYEFENTGYLAENMQDIRRALCKKYGKYLEICEKLNTYGQHLQYELDIHNQYIIELLAALYFSRVLSTYQAALILSYRGMKHQVMMLIRCMSESLFPLVAISKDSSFVTKLVESDEIERLKAIKKIIQYKIKNHADESELSKARELAYKLQTNIDQKGIKKISVYNCAYKAELEDMYNTLYSYTSFTVHSSVRSLEEDIILSINNEITELKNEPDIEGFDILLISLAESLMLAITALCEIFELPTPNIIEECQGSILQLHNHTTN